MLNQFKTFNEAGSTLEDLMALKAFGAKFAEQFMEYEEEVPDWVVNKLAALDAAIKGRLRDKKLNELKSVETRLDSLKTPSEKKTELKNRAAKLKKQLALA